MEGLTDEEEGFGFTDFLCVSGSHRNRVALSGTGKGRQSHLSHCGGGGCRIPDPGCEGERGAEGGTGTSGRGHPFRIGADYGDCPAE